MGGQLNYQVSTHWLIGRATNYQLCIGNLWHGTFPGSFFLSENFLIFANACYIIPPHDVIVIHCINLEYTGKYYLLISALNKFCHPESLWVSGVWYVSSEHLLFL